MVKLRLFLVRFPPKLNVFTATPLPLVKRKCYRSLAVSGYRFEFYKINNRTFWAKISVTELVKTGFSFKLWWRSIIWTCAFFLQSLSFEVVLKARLLRREIHDSILVCLLLYFSNRYTPFIGESRIKDVKLSSLFAILLKYVSTIFILWFV
jgi:hypothetical protein